MTFEGWQGDPSWFRIGESAIVGGDLQKRIPRNEFLCSSREFNDLQNPNVKTLGVLFLLLGIGVLTRAFWFWND